MDLDQLRKRAKELKSAVRGNDADALGRVLASHPNYAGRPPERLSHAHFSLRDAQVTIARELGFEGWSALTDAARGPAAATRWAETMSSTATGRRAWRLALDRRDRVVTAEHLLWAISSSTSPAAAVLNALGWTPERCAAGIPDTSSAGHAGSVTSSPHQQALEAFAQGIALGMGSVDTTDEHLLVALAYEDRDRHGGTLSQAGLDPEEILDTLRQRGVRTPKPGPPPQAEPAGPHGPRVYVPQSVSQAVSKALQARHPPPPARWGLNLSTWKPGTIWFDAEDSIDLPALARAAVDNPAVVEVVAFEEAVAAEESARIGSTSPSG